MVFQLFARAIDQVLIIANNSRGPFILKIIPTGETFTFHRIKRVHIFTQSAAIFSEFFVSCLKVIFNNVILSINVNRFS